jgi:hypothetical protein
MNHKGPLPVSIRPSDSLRLRARKIDKATDIAELIVASGQMSAKTGRTYDCTVPRGSKLVKTPCLSGRSTYDSEPRLDAKRGSQLDAN